MFSNRKRRREQDPGLQPERTSLAWFRTLLGLGTLSALILRHHALLLGWAALFFLAVALIFSVAVYLHAQKRNLMDPERERATSHPEVINNLFIFLCVLLLSVLALWGQLALFRI